MTTTAIKESKAMRTRDYLASLGIWVPGSVVVVWLALLPTFIPHLRFDRGIFVSVAERILAGDVLYRDVWDNKDPLFYFSIALGRLISPYADVLLEVAWIACAATAVHILARRRGCNSRSALFIACAMTPLILTGSLYVPGFTHLPGTALTLLIMASAVSGRYAASGALLAILTFLKIVMMPIAFLLLFTIIAIRRKWFGVLRSGAAFALFTSAILSVLHARGELIPYVESLVRNVTYSQGSVIEGQGNPIIEHLLRSQSVGSGTVLATILLASVWMFAVSWRKSGSAGLDQRSMIHWACTGASLLAALAVLGLTGLWTHHAQVLYVPAILVATEVVRRLETVFNVQAVLPVVAFVCLAILLSGPVLPLQYVNSVLSAPQALRDLREVPPETQAILSVGQHGTYARVGQNDDRGHAYGLGNWKLACPRFHQYPFDPAQALEDVAGCLPKASVVVVSPSAVPVVGNTVWNAYLERVETLLRTNYSCTEWSGERICKRLDV